MQREKTGVGQSLSVSLYDSMLAMQMQEASMWLSRKQELNWGAFPLTGVFQTTEAAGRGPERPRKPVVVQSGEGPRHTKWRSPRCGG